MEHVAVSGIPEREDALRLRDGRRLAWSEWGPADGRPVMLLQGAPGSSHYCPDVEATAALGVRLISIDRPGYGESDARPGRTLLDWPDDAAEWFDRLAIGAAPMVGWSSGVPFALACAFRLPDRVPVLALVAGDGPIDEVPGVRASMPTVRADRIALARSDPAGARVAAMERARFYAENPDAIVPWTSEPPSDVVAAANPDAANWLIPEQREALLEMFRHGARNGADGWVDDSIALSLPWGFSPSQVRCPTTIWYGCLDQLASRADSEFLASAVPGARIVIEPDEGHTLPVRHWREILEDLLAA